MAVSLKHTFQTPVVDEAEPNKVGPDEWNAEHTLLLGTDKLLGRDTAGTGAAEEIGVTSPLSFDGSGNITATAADLLTAIKTVDGTGSGLDADTLDGVDSASFLTAATAASTYLTTATAASTYQPLDSDLTSWAGITRAAGFDTFTTTPSSANLASLVTGETGSGALVFNDTPTLIAPLLGTPTSGTLTNCTGLPASGLVATTVTAVGFGTIELGHATANTLSASSGNLSIEGNVVYRAGGTTIPVTDGGTGRATGTTAYSLIATGTTATGADQTLANGATTEILVGGGASALPVWTTAQGSGAPVRATSPTLTTPVLGTPTSGTLTNCTGLPIAGLVASTSTAIGVGSVELGHATANTLTGASGKLDIEGHTVLTDDEENQACTGGCTITEKDLGTVSSGTTTLDMGDRPMHKYTNNGAHTLAPGTTIGSSLIAITNGASAGAITTSGWTKKVGDAFTTTNGNKFLLHTSVSAVGSLMVVQAMQ